MQHFFHFYSSFRTFFSRILIRIFGRSGSGLRKKSDPYPDKKTRNRSTGFLQMCPCTICMLCVNSIYLSTLFISESKSFFLLGVCNGPRFPLLRTLNHALYRRQAGLRSSAAPSSQLFLSWLSAVLVLGLLARWRQLWAKTPHVPSSAAQSDTDGERSELVRAKQSLFWGSCDIQLMWTVQIFHPQYWRETKTTRPDQAAILSDPVKGTAPVHNSEFRPFLGLLPSGLNCISIEVFRRRKKTALI